MVGRVRQNGSIGRCALVQPKQDVRGLVIAKRNLRKLGPCPVHPVGALIQAEAAFTTLLGTPWLRPIFVVLFGSGADQVSSPLSADKIMKYRAVDAHATGVPRHFALDQWIGRIE